MTRFTCLLAGLLLLVLHPSSCIRRGPRTAKTARLRWFGQSFFQLETSAGKKIVFDPHAIPEFGRNVLDADIVSARHPHNDHTQLGGDPGPEGGPTSSTGWRSRRRAGRRSGRTIDEKVGQIRVRTVGTYHDPDEGHGPRQELVFVVEADGLMFCHLGDLGHELTAGQVKAIGPVDVLMVPVGGIYTINGGQAKQVVEQLKPRRYVLPMHYGVPGYDGPAAGRTSSSTASRT